jgi:hypothetical protein
MREPLDSRLQPPMLDAFGRLTWERRGRVDIRRSHLPWRIQQCARRRARRIELHHLDEDWLRYAYDLTRKDGAVGVHGRTAADHEASSSRT